MLHTIQRNNVMHAARHVMRKIELQLSVETVPVVNSVNSYQSRISDGYNRRLSSRASVSSRDTRPRTSRNMHILRDDGIS